MDIYFLTALIISWVGICGSISSFSNHFDTVLKLELKETISRWLRGFGQEAQYRWTETIARLFDRIFGEHHITLKCFLKSCIASVISCLIVFAFWSYKRPDEFNSFWANRANLQISYFIGLIFFLNLFSDYLSLLETRYVIRWMEKFSTNSIIILYLLLDFIFTTSIAFTAFVILFSGEGRILFFFTFFLLVLFGFYAHDRKYLKYDHEIIVIGIIVGIIITISIGYQVGIFRGIVGGIGVGIVVGIGAGIGAGIGETILKRIIVSINHTTKKILFQFLELLKIPYNNISIDNIVLGIVLGIIGGFFGGFFGGIVAGIGAGMVGAIVGAIIGAVVVGIIVGIVVGISSGVVTAFCAGICGGIGTRIGGILSIPFKYLLSIFSGFLSDNDALPFLDIINNLWHSLFLHSTVPGEPTLGIFIYSTFLTSVWIWLYAVACVLIKFWSGTRWGTGKIFGIFDIDKYPFLAIGMVMNFLVTVGFVLFVVCRWWAV